MKDIVVVGNITSWYIATAIGAEVATWNLITARDRCLSQTLEQTTLTVRSKLSPAAKASKANSHQVRILRPQKRKLLNIFSATKARKYFITHKILHIVPLVLGQYRNTIMF